MVEYRAGEDLRELGELSFTGTPHFHSISLGVDDVFKMRRQSGAINSWSSTFNAYSLGNIEDDASEAIFVKIDFLMIWDLSNGA